ncbi:MAG: hypothetical protein ACUVWP_03445 [bacterium]
MKITKNRALELIDKKISQFEEVLKEATFFNRYNEAYKLAYYGTETLLSEIFSETEKMNFRGTVSKSFVIVPRGGFSDEELLEDYKDHINMCISQLKVYKERIENFWEADNLIYIKPMRKKLFHLYP